VSSPNPGVAPLIVEQVSHRRQGNLVLDRLDHTFTPGHIHAIIGPNGAGKTSLLRLLGLLEKPDQGRIFLQDQDTTSLWPRCLELRRRLGFLHQNPLLFQGSVFENLEISLKYRTISRTARLQKIHEVLTAFGLTSLARRPASSLSGGEAQKVALARIMVFNPEVLLLDEPTANLDPLNTLEFERLVAYIHRWQGKTIILVTHDLGQAERLSHQVLFLVQGRLLECGPTNQVLRQPENEMTRVFLNRGLVVDQSEF
jgi:tungstate transport system ATP-binding protein